jgi:HEAT repeat protein
VAQALEEWNHDLAPGIRFELAALGLGRLGDRRAESPLIGLLKDKKDWVRAMAALALGQLRSRLAVQPL